MRRLFLLSAVWVLGTACVGKAKYNESLAEQDRLREQVQHLNDLKSDLQGVVSERDQTIATLQGDLSATQAGMDELTAQLARKVAEAGELEMKAAGLEGDVAKMQEALKELEMRKARTEAALAGYRDLVARFQAMIDAGTLKVKVLDGRLVVELATDILFPPGSASLSKEGQDAIRDVAQVLADIPDRTYQVGGHTDNVPIASQRFPSNWHLGAARAISVADLLVESGLSGTRVSAASYSEHRPVDTNRTPEGKANNRRIEISITPDLSMMPGYEELEKLGKGEAVEVERLPGE